MYLEKIAGLFNYFILFVIIIVGAYTLVADVPKLKRLEYTKEMKLARGIGFFCIFGGLISFIALKVLL